MDRRTFLTLSTASAAGLVGSGLLAGCSTGPSGSRAPGAAGSSGASAASAADTFPVRIEHHFGETTIPQQPTRVATVGANDPDNVLALGVVPIGMTKNSYGGNDRGSTPWFDDRLAELDGDLPTLYDNTDAIPVDDIAALAPDVILAANSGLTRAEYDKLSKIAPVIAYPGDPWVTTWQDTVTLDGRALGRSDQAARLVRDTETLLARARARFPQAQGKSFIFAALSASDLSSVSYYTPQDQRPRLLVSLGMLNAPIVEQISKTGQFYGTVSAERAADLVSDVLITYGEKPTDAATFADDTLIGQIPAVKAGHLSVITDTTIGLAASVPTPLSIPFTLENLMPAIEQAATDA